MRCSVAKERGKRIVRLASGWSNRLDDVLKVPLDLSMLLGQNLMLPLHLLSLRLILLQRLLNVLLQLLMRHQNIRPPNRFKHLGIRVVLSIDFANCDFLTSSLSLKRDDIGLSDFDLVCGFTERPLEFHELLLYLLDSRVHLCWREAIGSRQ
jgi:hypothetical protein